MSRSLTARELRHAATRTRRRHGLEKPPWQDPTPTVDDPIRGQRVGFRAAVLAAGRTIQAGRR